MVEYKVRPGTNGAAAPNTSHYLDGLEKASPCKQEIDCLRVHLSAPGRSITMTDIGISVFNQCSAAQPNRVYGTFGKKLASAMEVLLPPDDDTGLFMIGVFPEGKNSRGRSPLVMHESLAQALDKSNIKPYSREEAIKISGGDLLLDPQRTSVAWIRFNQEVEFAVGSKLPPKLVREIEIDLGPAEAMEGMDKAKWLNVRQRAPWLAHQFALDRKKRKTLHCDECGFDPVKRLAETSVKPRSALDVHHMNPLAEGQRRTTIHDFALLCPTCHRIAHLLLRAQVSSRAGPIFSPYL